MFYRLFEGGSVLLTPTHSPLISVKYSARTFATAARISKASAAALNPMTMRSLTSPFWSIACVGAMGLWSYRGNRKEGGLELRLASYTSNCRAEARRRDLRRRELIRADRG